VLIGNREEELIRLCQKGDRSSFSSLYHLYERKVRATLYQLCGLDAIDDLTQEVFLRVWKALPKLKQVKYFSTWLYRITWNVAVDQRRIYAQRSKEKTTYGDADALEAIPAIGSSQGDVMTIHYQNLVQMGLESLSLEQRAVVVLHDLEDLPQQEVAEILSIPVGTVKSRLFNGRKTLRNFLENQGVSL
jgi:RNA polymerase sigma-70 factor (ECF subfamily)